MEHKELTYKFKVVVDYFEVMRVWYRSVCAVSTLSRAANRVAHVTKTMKVVRTHHLLTVVTEATDTHNVTLGAGKPKNQVIPVTVKNIEIISHNITMP